MSNIFERESISKNVTSKDTKSEKVTSSKDIYKGLKEYAEYIGNDIAYCRFVPKQGNIDPVLYINYKTEDVRVKLERKIHMFPEYMNLPGLGIPLIKSDEERSNFTIWINKTRNEDVITLKRYLIEFIFTDPEFRTNKRSSYKVLNPEYDEQNPESEKEIEIIPGSYEDFKHQSNTLKPRMNQITKATSW